MPKVDPETGEPMSDDPEQESDELRGGKTLGDPETDKGEPQGTPKPFDRNT